MANEGHVALIGKGYPRWHQWRGEEPDTTPDLSGWTYAGSLQKYNLEGADFTNAVLRRADLREANLRDANFSGADLTEAELGHTSWEGATVDRATKLDRVRFAADHPVMNDGSEWIRWSRRDTWLHWGIVRRLGSLPLFEVSYVALTAAVVAITGIGYLNSTEFFDTIDYPIPMPGRIVALLFSSLLLAIGSTIYRLACPDRVQEFSETQWVEQHGRPRLLYRVDAIRRRALQVPAAVCMSAGALWGLWLLADRVTAAIRYIF